jgi:hypothetical protein
MICPRSVIDSNRTSSQDAVLVGSHLYPQLCLSSLLARHGIALLLQDGLVVLLQLLVDLGASRWLVAVCNGLANAVSFSASIWCLVWHATYGSSGVSLGSCRLCVLSRGLLLLSRVSLDATANTHECM